MPIIPRFDEKENRWADIEPMTLVIQAPRGKLTRKRQGGITRYDIQAENAEITIACEAELDGLEPDFTVATPIFMLTISTKQKGGMKYAS